MTHDRPQTETTNAISETVLSLIGMFQVCVAGFMCFAAVAEAIGAVVWRFFLQPAAAVSAVNRRLKSWWSNRFARVDRLSRVDRPSGDEGSNNKGDDRDQLGMPRSLESQSCIGRPATHTVRGADPRATLRPGVDIQPQGSQPPALSFPDGRRKTHRSLGGSKVAVTNGPLSPRVALSGADGGGWSEDGGGRQGFGTLAGLWRGLACVGHGLFFSIVAVRPRSAT
jgi:hypothetical protein